MKVSLQLAEPEAVAASRAIVLYESRSGGQAFATINHVSLVGDRPVIGPGRCLTREAVQDTLSKLLKRSQHREILPGNVLWFGDSRLCWHVPSQRRPIFFKTSDPQFNKEMNGVEVLHPPLVFIARPGQLSIWAVASDARPEGSTTLCQAPYFNVYDDGLMCRGNATLPDVPAIEQIGRFERAFFETNFTHTNTARLVAIEGGHNAYWRWQAAPEAKLQPEALLPLKLTLQEALNR